MNTTTEVTIEWAPFELAETATEEQLVAASAELEQGFLKQQDGYIRRDLFKGKDGQWVDLVYWESPHAASEAMKVANTSEKCMAYFSLMKGVEGAEADVEHYTLVGAWS